MKHKVEKKVYIETFVNWYDASNFIEKYLDEHDDSWFIDECDIKYINHSFRASIIFSRRQTELFGELVA